MNITFFYPSKRVGGAQLLFVRMAWELSKSSNIRVNVIDYADGFLKAQLAGNEKVHILNFVNGSVKLIEPTILVTPLSNIGDLKYSIKGDYNKIKILFWCIHPANLKYAIQSKGRKLLVGLGGISNYIKEMSESVQIVYMDSANSSEVSRLIMDEFSPVYMPIPLAPAKQGAAAHERGLSIENKLNLAWLGRLSDDKVYSVLKIIEEIQEYERNFPTKFHFHIIGDGEKREFLKNYLTGSKIDYTLVGTLTGATLEDYLLTKVDFGIAMGTSAMELASRNIPVFLIDFSYNRFPKNIKYNWLFETEDYTLGEAVEYAEARRHTFEELISMLASDVSLAAKCLEYVNQHHNIEVVAQKFKDVCIALNGQDSTAFKVLNRRLNPLPVRIIWYFNYYLTALYLKIRK